MSFAGLIFPSRPQLFLLFLLPLLTKPFRPVNMKLASREVTFIFGGAHENKTERAAHRRTIISIEKEQYSPSLMLAYRLALVFGVTVEELCCLAENKSMEDAVYENL